MDRRQFLQSASLLPVAAACQGPAPALAPLCFQDAKSDIKITGVRMVRPRPRSPLPAYAPAPGGPKEVYARFEEDNQVTRGPEGIYMRPPDRPGLGIDVEVD